MHGQVETKHDVVIVGGRVAGAATAMQLARAGLDVLVLERSHYGADTLSTHALMRAGVIMLERWGVLDAIVRAGTPAVRQTTFTYAADEVTVPIEAAHGTDALYAPRRTVLDRILVDAARAAGATVDFGTAVSGVTRDASGRVDAVVGRDRHNRTVRHVARWIVGADGLRSIVARTVGARVERRGTGVTAAVYGYWDGLDADRYRWCFRRDAVAGVIPTNDARACVFAVAAPTVIGRGGPAVLQRVVRAAQPELADRLQSRRASGVRTFTGEPSMARHPWGAGWALVGDAGYWKDPIGAHGITSALRDAQLLSNAIVSAAIGIRPEADAFAHYHATRNRLSAPLFDVIDAMATMQWTDDEIPRLLRRLSAAMTEEVEFAAATPSFNAPNRARLIA
jgi:2-polyprenyl-6-methoxyphenol hydroxylase-like FAD-dependent oxidoreductase